jgi:D-arabinose 1-dehydrogenase-like Zn-dependent alcohol dehydrogenase
MLQYRTPTTRWPRWPIMGTFQDMKRMISLIIETRTKPEIGQILPMERAREAFQAMWEGETHGKTVFTR